MATRRMDCRVRSDSSGVRGDLRAMYEECARECARWNINPGGRTVALAVLQSDDHWAPSSALMQKELLRSISGYNTESINLWSDSLQRPN